MGLAPCDECIVLAVCKARYVRPHRGVEGTFYLDLIDLRNECKLFKRWYCNQTDGWSYDPDIEIHAIINNEKITIERLKLATLYNVEYFME